MRHKIFCDDCGSNITATSKRHYMTQLRHDITSALAGESAVLCKRCLKKQQEKLNDETMKELTGETDAEYTRRVNKKIKACKHTHIRYLDCQDCRDKGKPCPVIVCCDCGETIRS